jgi:hypothetical protein
MTSTAPAPLFTVRPPALDAFGRLAAHEYALAAPWWKARGGESPSREMLPGCGAVVERAGRPLAVAFLYLDACQSGVGWLGWLATDPAADPHAAGLAVRHAVRYLCRLASQCGYWCLFASYHHPALIRLLGREGFQTGDRGMVQLFKPLT